MRKGHARILKRPVLTSDQPVHEQVAAHLRGLIASGAIAKGARMPAQRSLAKDLRVSRNTVTAAYDRLCAEGLLETRKGAGTYVVGTPHHGVPLEKPQLRGRELPLHQGVPDLDLFPRDVWRKLQDKVWRAMPSSALGYNDPAGWPDLRLVLAQRAWATRGVRRSAEQVFVTASSATALQLAAKALQLAGREVVVECPGYLKNQSALRSCGARLRSVAVDGEGLIVPPDHSSAAAIVTPASQFPLGIAMSSQRRAQLLTWAGAAGAWVIEDDYEGDFSFEGEAPPALAADANGDRVLYLSTLNSVMFPSLQIAAIIVPAPLVDAFQRVLNRTQAATNSIAQMIAYEFINDGHLAAHIRRCHEVYSERRALLRSLLLSELAGAVSLCGQPMGLHVTTLLTDSDDYSVQQRAAVSGLTVHSLTSAGAGVDVDRRSGIYMGFAGFQPAIIRRSVSQLARTFASPRRG